MSNLYGGEILLFLLGYNKKTMIKDIIGGWFLSSIWPISALIRHDVIVAVCNSKNGIYLDIFSLFQTKVKSDGTG